MNYRILAKSVLKAALSVIGGSIVVSIIVIGGAYIYDMVGSYGDTLIVGIVGIICGSVATYIFYDTAISREKIKK